MCEGTEAAAARAELGGGWGEGLSHEELDEGMGTGEQGRRPGQGEMDRDCSRFEVVLWNVETIY